MTGSTSVPQEIAVPAANGVGESAHWSIREQALYWVDITGRTVERYEPGTRRRDSWPMPGFPEAIALRRTGGAILALDNRVCLFDFSATPRTLCIPEPDRPGNRLNEGVCDPEGRFWVGSMQNNIMPDGSPKPMDATSGRLFRIDADGSATLADPHDYGISNTMAWRDDGTLLFGDTLAQTIYAFDYDRGAGTIGRRRVFAHTPDFGHPDGSCLDADGCLWNARFGGGALLRYKPDGTIDRVVKLPVRNPTSCAFGGHGLSTLFVTSARFGLSRDEIAANPNEGALLALDVGVAGVPASEFAG
jgi:sugar lactone lactonase YvrE